MAGQYPPQGPYPPQQPGGAGNPYHTPSYPGAYAASGAHLQRVKGRVVTPAVVMLVLSGLNLLLVLLSLVLILAGVRQPDPDVPETIQQFQTGPPAVILHLVFVVVDALILTGSAFMLQMKNWGLAMMAAILSMINIAGCCCVVGLPVGIWAAVVLSAPEVKAAFQANARTSSGYRPPGGGYPPGGPQQPMPPYGR